MVSSIVFARWDGTKPITGRAESIMEIERTLKKGSTSIELHHISDLNWDHRARDVILVGCSFIADKGSR